MEIHDIYRFEEYYVYEGLCDGRETKWITKNKWDYKIILRHDGVGVYPVDSKGDFMTILEKDIDIEKWNIVSKKIVKLKLN